MFYYLVKEVVRGDPSDPNNSLQYNKVVLNAIGPTNFNPALPNVYKWDALNKRVAGELVAYVNDL